MTIAPRQPEYVDFLLDQFSRHFVSIEWVDVPRGSSSPPSLADVRQFATSAFVVSIRSVWFIVTAGHIVNARRARLASQHRAIRTNLVDGLANEGRFPPIPFDLESAPTWFHDASGIDFAVIGLSPLYAAQLSAGGIVPLAEEQWDVAPDDSSVRCIIGLPTALTSTAISQSGKEVCVRLSAHLIGLPLQPIDAVPYSLAENSEFRVYGRIPVGHVGDQRVDDIDGLSGSPVVELVEVSPNEYAYRVVAVQGSWLPSQRVIAATHIRPALHAIGRSLDGDPIQARTP